MSSSDKVSSKNTISESEISSIEHFDDVLNIVGSYGKYQKILLYAVVGPFTAFLPIFYLNSIFLLSEPDHWCHVDRGIVHQGTSLEQWKNLTIPREIGPDGTERFSHCRMYTSLENNTEISCTDGWDYDRSDYTGTIPTDFNWVCDKSGYVTQSFTLVAAGSAIGTIIFGWAGDRYGRKPFFFTCCFILVFFRFVSLFVPNYFVLYLIVQFFTGSVFPMIYIFIYSLTAEIFGKEHRSWIYGFAWLIWVIGICFLPLVAWLVKNWFILGLLTSVPGILLLFYYNFVPESPRWLLTQNRLIETEKILEKIATTNGRIENFRPGDLQKILKNLKMKQDKQNEGQGKIKIWNLFSKKYLGINTILLSISWSINGIIYYGITLNTTQLAGNQFLNFFILSIIELPTGWVGGTLAEKTGRRWTQVTFFFLAAIGFGLAVLGTSYHQFKSLIIISLIISKFAVAVTTLIVTMQGTEIFPTELRSSGNGFSCSLSSILTTCTPYILFLGKYHVAIPYGVFGILCLIGSIATSFLPETLKQSLPETLDEANDLGRTSKYWSFLPTDYKTSNKSPSVHLHMRSLQSSP